MQMRVKVFAVLCTVTFLGFSTLANDYTCFITDDGHLYQDATNGQRFIPQDKIDEAKKADDSRPAEQDLEGNWGKPQFGCQVSLRFAKTNFSTNQPIAAKLIIRDVSETNITFSFRPPPVASCLTVFGPEGNSLDRIEAPNPRTEREAEILYMHVQGVSLWLGPGVQRIFELDLRNHFDFAAPGRYTVSARPGVLDPVSKKYTAVEPVKTEIFISPPSSGTNSIEARPPK